MDKIEMRGSGVSYVKEENKREEEEEEGRKRIDLICGFHSDLI